MLTVHAARTSADDPLSALEIGDLPEVEARPGWVRVHLRASALNHHDVWSLRGVGLPADRLPMVLGCDGAGTLDDGTDVLVHCVVASDGWSGDETLDPRRTLLSERYPGTFAEYVTVPARNVVAKPADLPWEHAAVLPVSWLTAYRMLFTQAQVRPGSTVLVQGAGGGVATALVQLGAAAGLRMWVTSRDEAKAQRALELGAEAAFASGERLPRRVDAVMETVGAATWQHSVKSCESGGTIVISGATTGDDVRPGFTDVFFRQLRVLGSTAGTRAELERLVALVSGRRIEPLVDEVMPLADARRGFEKMVAGDVMGKIVFTHPA